MSTQVSEPPVRDPNSKHNIGNQFLWIQCVTNAGPGRYAAVEKSPLAAIVAAWACSVSGPAKAKSATRQLFCRYRVTMIPVIDTSSRFIEAKRFWAWVVAFNSSR